MAIRSMVSPRRYTLIAPLRALIGLSISALIALDSGGSGQHMPSKTPVHSDPEILGGTPVFVGTRVPVKSLYDYLEAGDSLNEFLESFPSVTREQAVAALELARSMTEAHATAAR
jgi:uncharacterized protein (DUF433 family)